MFSIAYVKCDFCKFLLNQFKFHLGFSKLLPSDGMFYSQNLSASSEHLIHRRKALSWLCKNWILLSLWEKDLLTRCDEGYPISLCHLHCALIGIIMDGLFKYPQCNVRPASHCDKILCEMLCHRSCGNICLWNVGTKRKHKNQTKGTWEEGTKKNLWTH